jgi:hypothetical protein
MITLTGDVGRKIPASPSPEIFLGVVDETDLVEDRQPPRLYLELVRPPDSVDDRAAAIAAAGWDVSIWDPATTQDDDLPRTLSRSEGVVIGEGDGGVVEPASPASTAVSLVRYPRPAQGCCSGERTTGILLVLISPKHPEFAQDLRDWGDFVHLRYIAEAAVPGYRMITPWENESGGTPRFCHLYEMVGRDPQVMFEAMTPLVRARLDSSTFAEWAWHPQLVIDESRTYVRREPT